MSTRVFTPYEKNQLQKYGLSLDRSDSDQTPVEYLTGHVDFAGYDFIINKHVLIPRIETQEIIPLVLKLLQTKNYNKPNTILDLATGSGAVGISLSSKLLDLNIDHHLYLSDISSKALSIAQKNAQLLIPLHHQPTIIKSNLFSSIPQIKFDLITANLPYIPSGRIKTLDPSVKDHEPHLALDGGPDGASLINQFIKQLPPFLTDTFIVVLEIDHTHTLKSFELAPHFSAKVIHDSFGFNRFLILSHQSV